MGLLNRAITNRRVQPVPYELGPWSEERVGALPSLDPEEVLWLATFRALLELEPGRRTSSFLLPGQKLVGSLNEIMNTQYCLLRAETFDHALGAITCGSPSPVDLTADWTVEATEPTSTIDVPSYRTLDGELMNHDLLEEARKRLASTLAEGPGRITVEPGLPDLPGLVQVGPPQLEDERSAFSDDYLLPVPTSFVNGARIPIPPDDVEALRRAFTDADWPSAPRPEDDVLAGASLGGGRPGHRGRVVLRDDVAQPALVLDLPSESESGRQRTFRAAAILIDDLATRVRDEAQAVAETLSAQHASWTALHRDQQRVKSFSAAWTRESPAAAVLLRPGLGLPIGLIVRGDSFNVYAAHTLAEAWLPPYQRLFTRGFRAKTQEENRVYLQRGPTRLWVNGKVLPTYVRYAHCGATEFQSYVPLNFNGSATLWFWETRVRSRTLEDGSEEGVLLVTGLSRIQNVLCYGQELVRLIATFGWLIREQDPGAEIQTLTLWL